MKFDSLELKNYRNFAALKLDFSPTVNIFIGKNGQGKTNLLESLYFMTQGESFRPGHLSTFQKIETNSLKMPAVIRGKVSSDRRESHLEVKIAEGKKNHLIDQKKTSTNKVAKNFPTVLFSPDSLASIKQGPEQRRALIDDFLSSHHQNHRSVINEYKKVLRSRNKLLKSLLKAEISFEEFSKTFDSINPLFFQRAAELASLRIQSLKVLEPKMQESLYYILKQENLNVELDYIVSEESAREWSFDHLLGKITNRADALRSAELASGTSLVGPHKHDIQFLFNAQDSRYYCSQGQQRALILSFKMAQIVYHYEVYQNYPVLLLDDVMSELDLEKRKRLIEFLSQINAQILITTTEFDFPEAFEKEQVRVFEIESGQIKDSKFS